MIIKASSAVVHNRIANHADVFHALWSLMPSADQSELCFDKCIGDDRYILLHNEAETAAMIFERTKTNIWDTHSLFLPECRGRDAIKYARMMGSHMFENEGAECLWGYGIITDKAARWFFRQIGGISTGFGEHPLIGPVEYFAQSRDQWKALHTK